MKRIIPDHEMLPFAYGVAWYDYQTRCRICYPLPLNYVVALARKVYHYLLSWRITTCLDDAWIEGYKMGNDNAHKSSESRIRELTSLHIKHLDEIRELRERNRELLNNQKMIVNAIRGAVEE